MWLEGISVLPADQQLNQPALVPVRISVPSTTKKKIKQQRVTTQSAKTSRGEKIYDKE